MPKLQDARNKLTARDGRPYAGTMVLYSRRGTAPPLPPHDYAPVVSKKTTIWVRATWLPGVGYEAGLDRASPRTDETVLNSVPLEL